MKQTFNDFVMECALFEYSRDYYEAMHEAAELDLMMTYLGCQDFTESMDDYKSDGYTFTEGYFMEADTEEKKEEVSAKADVKSGNIIKRIGARLKKVMNVIANFFKTIFNKLFGSKSVETVREKIKGIKIGSLSSEDRNRVEEAIKSAWDDGNNEMFKLGKGENFDLNEAFNSVVSDECVVYTSGNKEVNENSVVSIEDWSKVVEAANKIVTQKNVNGFKQLFTRIKAGNIGTYLKKNRIVLKMDKASLEKVTSLLTDGASKFADAINSLGNSDKSTFVGSSLAGAGTAVGMISGAGIHNAVSKFGGVKAAGKAIGNAIFSGAQHVANATAGGTATVAAGTSAASAIGGIAGIAGLIFTAWLILFGINTIAKGSASSGLTALFSAMNNISKNIVFMYKSVISFRDAAARNIAKLGLA